MKLVEKKNQYKKFVIVKNKFTPHTSVDLTEKLKKCRNFIDNFQTKYGDARIWVVNIVGKKRVHSWTKIRELMKEMENDK